MLYKSTSTSEIIGRIIRNTRLQDSSMIPDIMEWIPEAMGLMKTKFSMVRRYKDVDISFYKGLLPCGLSHVEYVEYNGCRLMKSNGRMQTLLRPVPTLSKYPGISAPFVSVPLELQTPIDTHTFNSTALPLTTITCDQCCNLPYSDCLWYDIEIDSILVPMEEACVRVHYKGIPLDEHRMPLVPDNENYMQGLYWYTRAMMIGAGFKDLQFNHQYCMQQFDKYSERAIGQITYPSVEGMDAKIPDITRFMPDVDFFCNLIYV